MGRNGLKQESGLTSAELVTNGDFATDSDWTKGTGWSISGGKAVATNVITGILIALSPEVMSTLFVSFQPNLVFAACITTDGTL